MTDKLEAESRKAGLLALAEDAMIGHATRCLALRQTGPEKTAHREAAAQWATVALALRAHALAMETSDEG